MEERLYWLGFSVASGVGPVKFQELVSTFGTAKNAWNASIADLKKVIGDQTSIKFDSFRSQFSIRDYEKQLKEKRVSFLTFNEPEYPDLLKQIQKPPFVLYCKGDIKILKQVQDDPSLGSGQARTIAVVGTRKTTQYGREVTRLFTQQLVDLGFVIVSGLAMGVDAIAHMTTIENSGKTIAVLGCGVDCCSPRENLSLYNSILQHGGCIVSELPLGHGPTKGTFPARNRIIMGLSIGVLVTEGAEDSGALITADYAFKNNRKVFAVPGPITSGMSKGPYKLIQKGAKLVTKVEDILNEFQISNVPGLAKRSGAGKSQISANKKIKGDSREEQKILDLLQNEPLQFDDIVRRSKFDSSKVGTLLTIMEMKGTVRILQNGLFGI